MTSIVGILNFLRNLGRAAYHQIQQKLTEEAVPQRIAITEELLDAISRSSVIPSEPLLSTIVGSRDIRPPRKMLASLELSPELLEPQTLQQTLQVIRALGSPRAYIDYRHNPFADVYQAYVQGGTRAAEQLYRQKTGESWATRQNWLPSLMDILQHEGGSSLLHRAGLKPPAIRNINVVPIVQLLERHFADIAPQTWQTVQPILQRALERAFRHELDYSAHLAASPALQEKARRELLTALISGQKTNIAKVTRPPRVAALLKSTGTPAETIPSVISYLHSLPTKEITQTGFLNPKGQSPAAQTYAAIRKQLDPMIQQYYDTLRSMKQEFSTAPTPASPLVDVVSRIIQNLPPDQRADWKTIKKLYPQEAAKFGKELQTIITKSGGDLRKVSSEVFQQMPPIGANNDIRALWRTDADIHRPAIVEEYLHELPHNLIIVGNPEIIHNIHKHSPQVAREYSRATGAHIPYLGNTGVLPPVGWVRMDKFSTGTGERWLITEIQSDLMTSVNRRLQELQAHKLAYDYIRTLGKAPQSHKQLIGMAVNYLNTLPSHIRPSPHTISRLLMKMDTNITSPPNIKELEYLTNLQSKFKNWSEYAVAEVLAKARAEGVERVHMLTSEFVSKAGLYGEGKLSRIYEDLPKGFKFIRQPLEVADIPTAPNYGTKGDIWSRVPVVIPPVSLLPTLTE